MNPSLEKLIALEKADREVTRLKDEIAALPKRVAEIETKLSGVRSEAEKSRTALKTQEAARRKLEADIQAHQQKISKYREQSLDVKTNDQYKALMHEVEFAEKGIRLFEDKILESMTETEAQEKALKANEAEVKAQSVHVEKEKAEAKRRTELDQAELARWNAERAALRAEVDESALAHYDRVMRQRKSATAEVRAQMCTACHVLVRPQKYNEIKTNEQILTCDSCGRILFFDPASEAAPEGQAASKQPATAGPAHGG